jgi:hypothetical protein
MAQWHLRTRGGPTTNEHPRELRRAPRPTARRPRGAGGARRATGPGTGLGCHQGARPPPSGPFRVNGPGPGGGQSRLLPGSCWQLLVVGPRGVRRGYTPRLLLAVGCWSPRGGYVVQPRPQSHLLIPASCATCRLATARPFKRRRLALLRSSDALL